MRTIFLSTFLFFIWVCASFDAQANVRGSQRTSSTPLRANTQKEMSTPERFFVELTTAGLAQNQSPKGLPPSENFSTQSQSVPGPSGSLTVKTMQVVGNYILTVVPSVKKPVRLTLYGLPRNIEWRVEDPSIVDLVPSDNRALLEFKSEGRTKIIISAANKEVFRLGINAEVFTDEDTWQVVVVRENKAGDVIDMYGALAKNGGTVGSSRRELNLLLLKSYDYFGQYLWAVANTMDVSDKNTDGAKVLDKDTQLIQAAYSGNLQAVKAALAESADPNITNKEGTPIIVWMAALGRVEITRAFLEKGAEVNVTRKGGTVTALYMASRQGQTEVVKLLLEKGAEVNVRASATTGSKTVLFEAVAKGHTEVVKLLLNNGADVNAKVTIDDVEWMAFDLAMSKGFKEIVQLLEKAGAK